MQRVLSMATSRRRARMLFPMLNVTPEAILRRGDIRDPCPVADRPLRQIPRLMCVKDETPAPDILLKTKTLKMEGRIMKQVVGIALALLIIAEPAWAGLEMVTGSSPNGRVDQAVQKQRVAENTSKGTSSRHEAGAPESRHGYHGDTSSKHGNAKFPERPENQHGHGQSSGGPQH